MDDTRQDFPSGGDIVESFLDACGVRCVFGVISVHNLPILDAIERSGRIRYVPARSEAGAVNMADAYARISGGLGVVVTSTGPGAGNAAGALVEALTAGTPLLHLTGQIETPYLDAAKGYLHETKDQLGMLTSVSKRAYRVLSSAALVDILRNAHREAWTPPAGPVSVEIPIDIQKAPVPDGWDAAWNSRVSAPEPDEEAVSRAAECILAAKRPLIWAGGGALGSGAGKMLQALAELRTAGVMTSACGRGVLPEDHPLCIGNFGHSKEVLPLYSECDLMILIGSHPRGHETKNWTLPFPENLLTLDADPAARNRNYPASHFVRGDARRSLERILERLSGRSNQNPAFASLVGEARDRARKALRETLGPYAEMVDTLRETLERDAVFVRDVTISNSTWGNRLFEIYGPRSSAHAAGGGIGQGLAMGIGAKAAAPDRQVVVLCGDGGLFVNVGEMATAAQENLSLVLLVFNDRGYGVIRNIQKVGYGGRVFGVDLQAPGLTRLAETFGFEAFHVDAPAAFGPGLRAALEAGKPSMVEVDMEAIGPYAAPFGGPVLDKSH